MPRQIPRLVAAPDGPGENRIAHDGHVWRVLLPVADDIGHAIFRVAWRLAVCHTQPSEMDDFRGLVALVHGRVFRAGMQPRFRPRRADFRQCFDMIPMRVRYKNVPELKLFGGDGVENRPGVESGVKERRLARDFIPDEIAIHRQPVARCGEHADFPPDAQILLRGQPPIGDGFKFLRIQANQRREFGEIDFHRGFPGFLQDGQFGSGYFRRGCRNCGGNAAHRPRLANNVTRMIFKIHAGTVAVGAHDRKHAT